MGTNKVKQYREKLGITVGELARRANMNILAIQQVERSGSNWGHCPWHEADRKIADALGVKLSEVFSDYQLPRRRQQVQPLPDDRTPEEQEEDLRRANEALRNTTKIADEYLNCQFVETSPGIFEGTGSFTLWRQQQERRNKK